MRLPWGCAATCEHCGAPVVSALQPGPTDGHWYDCCDVSTELDAGPWWIATTVHECRGTRPSSALFEP